MTEEQDLTFNLVDREQERRFIDLCLNRKLDCLIVGPGGIGKTTLLRYIVQHAPLVDKCFHPVAIDCSRIVSPEELWLSIAHSLNSGTKGSNVLPPAFGADQSSLQAVSDYIRQLLTQHDEKLVICLDSLDTLPVPVLDDLRVFLTYLTESESVVFATARDASLPFPVWLLNRFQTLYLGPLSDEAVEEGIQQHFATNPKFVTPDLVEKIGRLSGGHPLILKLILNYLSEDANSIEPQLFALESRMEAALPDTGRLTSLTPGQRALKSSTVNDAMLKTLSKDK